MKHRLSLALAAALLAASFTAPARADAVIDWNTRANALLAEAKMGTPPAVRVMAVVQTAVLQAVEAAQRTGAASADAAVAAATRGVLLRMTPALEAPVNAAYQSALAGVADNAARAAGIEAGEKAAAAVLAARADDGAATPERYRPNAVPGAYVPTAAAAAPQWGQRKPWLLARADQFRPGPPPPLNSAAWARDYNEVKAVGSRASTVRTPEQTEIARFWEYSLPSIYMNVARPVAAMPGRDLRRNARLYAALAQGMDDALIAVLEAKYHYNFWRPVTAIRNGDQDGNDATERDAGWASLIDSPLHPEYPSAHAILAGTVGTLLRAELGNARLPELSTTSGTLKGVTRRWSRVDDFMQEVVDARVYEGIHYRFSTEAGLQMGKQVGALAAERLLGAGH